MERIASSSQRKRKGRRRRRRSNEERVFPPLPNDVIEEILLLLPVKPLIRFKFLSKQWRSTIESRCFSQRHLEIAERCHVDHPKLMVISCQCFGPTHTGIGFKTICSESHSCLSSTLFNFPLCFNDRIHVSDSCDGLFCIHSPESQSMYVVNPATRWLRQLPLTRFQILTHKSGVREAIAPAFVKAADYKLVCLYNSDRFNSDASSPNEGVTKCEVFDFRADAWRYLTCTPSYQIFREQTPASANGSLYWFTEPYDAEIKVVAFDIRTEIFRLLPKIHPVIAGSDPYRIDMCTLDNRLCMSTRDPNSTSKEIWRLESSQDTWEKIYTIDFVPGSSSRSPIHNMFSLTPVAICKNKKILLLDRDSRNLVIYDPQRKTIRLFFKLLRTIYGPYVSKFDFSYIECLHTSFHVFGNM